MNRRLLLSTALVLITAGCAQVSHVATGDVTLKDRLLVTVDKPWNQFEHGLADNTPTWTQDGITVDALRFYVAVKDGELLAKQPSDPKGLKPLAFKSGMQPGEIVTLFESLIARDGSSFKLDRVTPQTFLGTNGFRFDFSSIRKHDEVRLSGTGWVAVHNAELFAVTFTAPRLSFYPRHLASAEAIAKSARLRP